MQNPKIKLFYILTVKTIKDIYVMNEEKKQWCVDCFLWRLHFNCRAFVCLGVLEKKCFFLLSLNGMSGPMSGLWG